jgi:hypothetical protein
MHENEQVEEQQYLKKDKNEFQNLHIRLSVNGYGAQGTVGNIAGPNALAMVESNRRCDWKRVGMGSAEWHSAVSRIGNPPCLTHLDENKSSTRRRITFGDTADYQSALHSLNWASAG